jgi:hypothetical protein
LPASVNRLKRRKPTGEPFRSPPAPRRPRHHHVPMRRAPPDLLSSSRAPTRSGRSPNLLHQCRIRRSRAPKEEIRAAPHQIRAAPAQRWPRRRRAALLRAAPTSAPCRRRGEQQLPLLRAGGEQQPLAGSSPAPRHSPGLAPCNREARRRRPEAPPRAQPPLARGATARPATTCRGRRRRGRRGGEGAGLGALLGGSQREERCSEAEREGEEEGVNE